MHRWYSLRILGLTENPQGIAVHHYVEGLMGGAAAWLNGRGEFRVT